MGGQLGTLNWWGGPSVSPQQAASAQEEGTLHVFAYASSAWLFSHPLPHLTGNCSGFRACAPATSVKPAASLSLITSTSCNTVVLSFDSDCTSCLQTGVSLWEGFVQLSNPRV